MNADMVLGLMRETVMTILMVAAPLLAAGLIIGVSVSIFQTVTQIREMTLTFVPKIVGVILIGMLFGPWMMSTIVSYASRMIQSIQSLPR
jgi:flagellar biosynthetic protein FliQ